MNIYEIKEKMTVMQNEDSLHGYFAWPTVARLQDGRLAAVASGYRIEHIDPFGKTVISYSADEGRTWTQPAPVIDTTLDDRDGGIVPFGETGILVTSFNNSHAMQRCWANEAERRAQSLEGEERKEAEARIAYRRAYIERAAMEGKEKEQLGSTYRVSNDLGITWGPLCKSPVTNPHGPALMKDGRFLHVGTMYGTGEKGIFCYAIDGKGGSEFLSALPHIPNDEAGELSECEPYAIILPSGKIIVHVRGERWGEPRVFGTWQCVSNDGGKTWDGPTMIGGSNCIGAPSHIMRHSSGKLIASLGNRKAPYGINILTSDDEGTTWQAGALIPEAPNDDLGYPSSVELQDGSILTIWYSHTDRHRPSKIYGAIWTL